MFNLPGDAYTEKDNFNEIAETIVDYGTQTETVANEFEFLRNFMTLNDEERFLIGHDFDSFIKDCTFRGKNCFDRT